MRVPAIGANPVIKHRPSIVSHLSIGTRKNLQMRKILTKAFWLATVFSTLIKGEGNRRKTELVNIVWAGV